MTVPPSEPVPAAVRAQMLATEHWSLLATRSQTWSEVMGRITGQFTFASAALVVLALAAQEIGTGDRFRWLAVGLAAAVLITGSMTALRVVNASIDDLLLVVGMNALRAAYVDIDPGIRRYLVTGATVDDAGIEATYAMGARRHAALQVVASSAMFVVVVNAIVAGVLTGLLADLSGAGRTALWVDAVLVAIAYVGVFMLLAQRGSKAPLPDLSAPAEPDRREDRDTGEQDAEDDVRHD